MQKLQFATKEEERLFLATTTYRQIDKTVTAVQYDAQCNAKVVGIFRKPINWTEAIAQAKKRGKFTIRDKMGSSSWMLCAVGEKSTKVCNTAFGINPRSDLSNCLYTLGMSFMSAVNNDDIEKAERLHKKICQEVVGIEAFDI